MTRDPTPRKRKQLTRHKLTRDPKHETRNPRPGARKLQTRRKPTRDTLPETRDPKPGLRDPRPINILFAVELIPCDVIETYAVELNQLPPSLFQ